MKTPAQTWLYNEKQENQRKHPENSRENGRDSQGQNVFLKSINKNGIQSIGFWLCLKLLMYINVDVIYIFQCF